MLLKLGLVKAEAIRSFMRSLEGGVPQSIVSEDKKPIPCPVPAPKLRAHKKLLEKVPADLVERYGILFFFPPPGTRAILMYSQTPIGPQGVKKLQDLLCVEICPIELAPEDVAPFVKQRPAGGQAGAAARKAAPPPKKGAKPAAPAVDAAARPVDPPSARPSGWETQKRPGRRLSEEVDSDSLVLKALVALLKKKQVITGEEIEVELQLLTNGLVSDQRRLRDEKAKKLVGETS